MSEWLDNLTAVEETVLSEVVYRYPEHLSASEFCQGFATGIDGGREIQVCAEAIKNLKQVGLLYDNEEVLAPTDAALRAAGLFMGCICETDDCRCYARVATPKAPSD